MLCKPDAWVIIHGLGGGKQDDFSVGSGQFLSSPDQLLPDPLPLMREADREIGEVSAEGEIG
jgi:hypothetical protein